MIIRQQRQNAESQTCSFYCEYGLADVRKALREYVQFHLSAFPSYVNFMGFSYSEDDVISILRTKLFLHLQDKHGKKFAKWAFKLAVEEKLIEESAVKPGTYYMSTALATKSGRPANEQE
jgi:hypothetical protein